MSEEIRVRNGHGLSCVIDRVHDFWLDLEEVDFDATSGILRVRVFEEVGDRADRPATREKLPTDLVMTLAHVESIDINDTERVRFYDINSISYDPDAGILTISTGIPLGFYVHVSDLDLLLHRIDTP